MLFKEWYGIRESETGTGDISVLRVCEGTCGDRVLDGENELLKEEGVLVEAGDLRYVPLYEKVEMCVTCLICCVHCWSGSCGMRRWGEI
jgi:hypothetical protein